ncbi:MAG: 16S rRNA (cytosine(1402)-N(4))-methyltransferase, partial [Verrucomicrobiota bacterium]
MSEHLPVMLQECLDALQAQAGGRFLDATFGGGGHARALLEASPETELVALDRDPAARARAEALETDFPGRITFISANFSEIGALELGSFEGALFDLGVSSFQLNEAARGFSFSKDAPADMRMNPEEGR